jgi:hypothetical protein
MTYHVWSWYKYTLCNVQIRVNILIPSNICHFWSWEKDFPRCWVLSSDSLAVAQKVRPSAPHCGILPDSRDELKSDSLWICLGGSGILVRRPPVWDSWKEFQENRQLQYILGGHHTFKNRISRKKYTRFVFNVFSYFLFFFKKKTISILCNRDIHMLYFSAIWTCKTLNSP